MPSRGRSRKSSRISTSSRISLLRVRLVAVVQTEGLLAPEQLVGPVEAHAQPAAAGDVSQGRGHEGLTNTHRTHHQAVVMVLNEAQSGTSIWSEGYRRAEIPATKRFIEQTQQYPMPAPKAVPVRPRPPCASPRKRPQGEWTSCSFDLGPQGTATDWTPDLSEHLHSPCL